MSRFLVYTPAAAGHVFPLVPGLLELQARGHTVHLRTGAALLRTVEAAGLAGSPTDARIEEIVVRDYEQQRDVARLREALSGLMARGSYEGQDLERAIAAVSPDALLVDTNTYGAAVAAERSGLPWATTLPSLLPLPDAGVPPYGLGMRPLSGPLGRLRNRVLWRVVERLYAKSMLPGLNALRADAGLPALKSPLEHLGAPDRLIVLSGAPLEYPRTRLPGHVRLVGGQAWDPPADPPDWLLEEGDPWVLVTCSTDYQGDEQLALTAIHALRDEPVRVLVTLADAHGATELPAADNVRVERFVPHGPVLERAAAVVCHAGMGIVNKAVAAGVPIVAVPFGRDQPEVARRVAESGAGVLLPVKELSPERLRAAVREAIALEPGLALLAGRFHAAGGAAAFADAAEELVAGRSRSDARVPASAPGG
jgi:UDP:flavonoid glycosyltransferase YjiC (YdhE family)